MVAVSTDYCAWTCLLLQYPRVGASDLPDRQGITDMISIPSRKVVPRTADFERRKSIGTKRNATLLLYNFGTRPS